MSVRHLTYEQVEALQKARKTRDEFPRTTNGYPLYNTCTHTFIDLSAPGEDPTAQSDMHTVSIRLPNGDYVTVCSIPYSSFTDGNGCLDIKYHGAKCETHVIAFNPGESDQRAKGKFYSLVYEK